MLPAHQLLKDFKSCTLHLTPEVSRALRHITSSPPTVPDLELEFSPDFHCFPIRSNTIPPFKTTNLIVVVSQTSGARGRTALLVDPGANTEGKDATVAVLRTLRAQGVGELLVFITHHHKDHWEGLPFLATEGIFDVSTVTVLGHKSSMDKLVGEFSKKIVDDGGEIKVGEILIKVIGTPGHTDNSLSLFHEPTRYEIVHEGVGRRGWRR
jgi:glyoxylase-like metal-dependent hydrolase (beta-lactamase superfamily II)